MAKRIAIVGTGISGLTSAYLLNRQHDITVFEANDYIGGHTATKDVSVNGEQFAIDTGFIVFNDWTYPNFIKLLTQLGVAYQETEMSFSVHHEKTNIEYNGHDLNTLLHNDATCFARDFGESLMTSLNLTKPARRCWKTTSP